MADKKDWFDRIVNTAQLVITALIGYFAYDISVSQEHSAESQASSARASGQFEVITGVLEKCSSTDKSAAGYFLNLYHAINARIIDPTQFSPDPEARVQFEHTLNFCWTQVSAVINQTGTASSAVTQPPTSTKAQTPSADNENAANWIYLGTYKGGKWETHYFQNFEGFDPGANHGLNSYSIVIPSGLRVNVRFGILNDATTQYPPSPCTVSGKTVKITQQIQWWSSSNNYWGRIDPREDPCNS
jgi:hypothetical protein